MTGSGDRWPGDRWPVWKLALLLYPFLVLTVAVNLFLAGLVAGFAGWQGWILSPLEAAAWSIPLSLPASWAAGRWVRQLMDEADGS